MNKFSTSVNLWRKFSSQTKTIIFHWINLFPFSCRHLNSFYRARSEASLFPFPSPPPSHFKYHKIVKYSRDYKLANAILRAISRISLNGSTAGSNVSLCDTYKSCILSPWNGNRLIVAHAWWLALVNFIQVNNPI